MLSVIYCTKFNRYNLFGWTLNRSVIDAINDIMRIHAINSASNRLGGSKDLLHAAGELTGHGARTHHSGGVDDVVHGDVAVVLDVLHLLPVPGRLLQSLDDKSCSRWTNRNLKFVPYP